MKKQWSLLLAALMALPMVVQNPAAAGDVTTIDSRSRAYRSGEVLVKFKSSSSVEVRQSPKGKFVTSGVNGVDAALKSLGALEVEPLMPLTSRQAAPKKVRSFSGQVMNVPEVSRLYRVKLDAAKTADVQTAIASLKKLPEVEFAEPNYLVYALATNEDITASESVSAIWSDPLGNQLWGAKDIGLTKLWKVPTLSGKKSVIAIIDTGVDTEHPDLAANIWTNAAESTGVEGADDDGNGFADDLHGWDFVNRTGRMRDNNGHGTHCAGIAAAVGGNKIGVVGANPDAQIMPIAVLQSDGVGDVATIIKGIDYATANGADVISMSFGGYTYSLAEEQALARAYASAVLVAAAGNDYRCIYPHRCSINKQVNNGPMYPAAFTFVLGVESSAEGNVLAGFSNYDEDGALFTNSAFFGEEQLYNYELRAPGVNILSTYPGGKYKTLSGTSMACPLAAGAISRLLMTKEYTNKEILFGDLIHTRNGNMDIYAAYNITDADRRPALSIVSYNLDDTEGGDGDNRADAGETIDLYPTLRNAWGQAENIKIWLTLGENEDPAIVELPTDKVDFGQPLSSYAKATGTNPIRFKVADNCVDGRHIKLQLHATCDNIADELVQDITLVVENGVEIGGVIKEDMTLHAGVHYIVTTPIAVPEGVTLTIEPGTVLKFKESVGINVEGHVKAVGTPEGRIVFTKDELGNGVVGDFIFNIDDNLEYVTIEWLDFFNASIKKLSGNLSKSTIQYCNFYAPESLIQPWIDYSFYDKINFTNCSFYATSSLFGYKTFKKSNFIGNHFKEKTLPSPGIPLPNTQLCNIIGNTISGKPFSISTLNNNVAVVPINSYLGTTCEEIAKVGLWDINDNFGYSEFDLSTMLLRPNPEAPGIVWKVVVNNYDAQDEFEMLPPLGVGKHKFEVYYSKPVSKDFTPTISMGVRPPYTQTAIAEEGSWNEAGDVYTAYLTLTGKMANDGLNRIYVSGGEDLEHFEIPVENSRFNVLVSAAGSMSTGFAAEAGLGKVDLTWEAQDENVDDILGYNLYRYEQLTDSTVSDTVMMNERLLDETTFTDFDVTPGHTYCYYYKIMRTNMAENSPSHTVAATPLTASKGDANGSMTIDVADVVTEIGYLTNQDPQPFIFEAADVNSDTEINILDVVGTVNIILTPEEEGIGSLVNATATYTVENGILYVETPVALAGLQFAFNAPAESEFAPLEALDGFEKAGQWTAVDRYTYLVYSMSGKTLAPGKHALMRIGTAETAEVILSDTRGKNVLAVSGDVTGIGASAQMQMQVPYPNPFTTQVTVPYIIGKEGGHTVRLVFTDLVGRVLHVHNAVQGYGRYEYTWRTNGRLTPGSYLVSLYVDGALMQTSKLLRVR